MDSEGPNAGSSLFYGSQETAISGGEVQSIGRDQYRYQNHFVFNMNPGTHIDLGNGSTLSGYQKPLVPFGDSGKGRSASPLDPGTQPHRSVTPEARASSSTEKRELPNTRYERHLLVEQHGFPLWAPQPPRQLPLSYRRKGVSVGDVGVITREGYFDFLFNICLPIGHASNPKVLPADFAPLDLSPTEISEFRQHDSGSCILTFSTEKLRGLAFKRNECEGSILVMPNGSYRKDLRNLHKFKTIASKNAQSWYRFAIEACGRAIGNGELRLVTGCDKTNSWGIATYSDFQPGTLTLAANSVQSSVEYTWDYDGRVDAKAGPRLEESLDAAGSQEYPRDVRNQCTFLRSFTITLGPKIWGTMDNLSLGRRGRSANTRNHSLGSKNSTTHPATAINQMLLSQYPNAKVAISHDDEWCAVIRRQDGMAMPDATELLKRIRQTFMTHLDDDGTVYLSQERAPEANSQRQSPSPDGFITIPEHSECVQETLSKAAGDVHDEDGKLSARAQGEQSEAPSKAVFSEVIASDDVIKCTSEPVSEDIPEPIFEDIPKLAIKDIPGFLSEDTPKPVIKDMPEPFFDDIPEPVIKRTPEPVSEDIPEPVSEDISKPIIEDIPKPVNDKGRNNYMTNDKETVRMELDTKMRPNTSQPIISLSSQRLSKLRHRGNGHPSILNHRSMGNQDQWWRKIAKSQDELFSDTREGDIIVPVISVTGAGKSTFINNYLNRIEAKVGHDLASCTASPQPFLIPLQPSEGLGPYRRLVLVDTPGFNNTYESDSEVLRRIAVWLASAYGEGKTCGGPIYLQDVTDAGMRAGTFQNISLFQSLCGEKNIGSVVFATTKSGSLTPEAFARRESQLRKEHWKHFMKQGARLFKLLPSHASAKELVRIVLERVKEEPRVLLIQHELVELKKTVPMTKAGRKLEYTLDEIMAHQREDMASRMVSEAEAAAIQAKVAVVGKQLESLKISSTDRVKMFFGLA